MQPCEPYQQGLGAGHRTGEQGDLEREWHGGPHRGVKGRANALLQIEGRGECGVCSVPVDEALGGQGDTVWFRREGSPG
jgi:hypothetical protein